MSAAAPEPVIEATGVSKRYGTVRALEDAAFAAVPGEIHALVGENGAGKSTLIKALCGVTKPDSGTIRAYGEEVRLAGPAAAQARGIGTVFQELTLLPWLTVAENLLIGREPRGFLGLMRRRAFTRRAAELLEEYGVTSVDPAALTADLSLAQRQVIEIVRTVSRDPKVLFLDEPTSSLAENEVDWLFGLVRGLRDQGTCVVFTSHRWHEVAGLSDRITVFRNGGHVATRDRLTEDEAVTLMTGRGLTETGDQTPAPATDRVVLQADDLRGGRLDGVSLTVRAGEILGVGGLEGQGQRDLFLALFGVQRPAGTIKVNGEPVRLRSPRDAAKAGIALVPEDRGGEGLFAPMAVRENLTLPIVGRLASAGLLRPGAERGPVQKMIERMRITARDPDQAVGTLSGGNQQKVLIGRWLLAEASVLLLYDVTRGVDVATKRDIFALMRDLAADGHAICYYSSDTEEIARLAHRVLVLREGRVAAELTGPGVAPEAIVSAAVREEAPDGDES